MSISTTTSLLLVNTFQNSGTVTLPSTESNLGRILIVKDQTASFDRNPCTLQTASGDSLDSGGTSRVLRVKGQVLELVAGVDHTWHTLADSQLIEQQVGSLTATSVSTLFFSASNLVAPAQAQQLSLRM